MTGERLFSTESDVNTDNISGATPFPIAVDAMGGDHGPRNSSGWGD